MLKLGLLLNHIPYVGILCDFSDTIIISFLPRGKRHLCFITNRSYGTRADSFAFYFAYDTLC